MTPPNRRFAFRSCLPLLTGAVTAMLAACTQKSAPPPVVPEVDVTEVIKRDVPIGAELTATAANRSGYFDARYSAPDPDGF